MNQLGSPEAGNVLGYAWVAAWLSVPFVAAYLAHRASRSSRRTWAAGGTAAVVEASGVFLARSKAVSGDGLMSLGNVIGVLLATPVVAAGAAYVAYRVSK